MNWSHIIGFWEADGSTNLNTKKRNYSITFDSSDKEVLDAILEFFHSQGIAKNVTVWTRPSRPNRTGWKTMYRITIGAHADVKIIATRFLEEVIMLRKRTRLYQILKWINAQNWKRGSLDDNVELIRSLYWDTGLCLTEIADICEWSYSGIKAFMKRHGIPKRSPSQAQKLSNKRNRGRWS